MHDDTSPAPRRHLRLQRRGGVLAGATLLAAMAFAGPQLGTATGQFRAEAQVPAQITAGPRARLISQSQYVNTIHHVFGNDIEVKVRLAPVNRVNGLLGVGASTAVLTGGSLDPLEGASRAIAEQVVAPERRSFLFPCRPADARAADAACAAAFFAEAGRLLYRRPLSQTELGAYVALAGRAAGPSGDFYDGVAYALSGMLVAPQFLFVNETTEPDPADPAGVRLDGYAKAARLSLLLWNSSPDDRLLEAAGRGDLHTAAGVKREVERMIASPLYEEGVRGFFADFLVMESFDTLAKDPTIYPGMTLKAISEAREQLMKTVVDHLVTRRGDYRDLFTTRRTFISSDLGVLYRLPVAVGAQGWAPYEFDAGDPRAGILTQIGFLSQHAHPGRSSATRRGRAVREILMCQHVPDPPPNVDFSNFEDPRSGPMTARERLDAHNDNPVCAGCHTITDPIGLGLENFDGAGQFRADERGAAIDASGELDGMAFQNAVGLGAVMRDSPALKSCVVNRLYAYGIGRKLTPADEAFAKGYQSRLDKQGYRFDTMLRLMILDPTFFRVSAPAQPRNDARQTAFAGG